jgi:hypothetical protein
MMLSQKTSNGMAKQKAPDARRAIVELRTSKQRGNRSNRSRWRVFATPSIIRQKRTASHQVHHNKTLLHIKNCELA